MNFVLKLNCQNIDFLIYKHLADFCNLQQKATRFEVIDWRLELHV